MEQSGRSGRAADRIEREKTDPTVGHSEFNGEVGPTQGNTLDQGSRAQSPPRRRNGVANVIALYPFALTGVVLLLLSAALASLGMTEVLPVLLALAAILLTGESYGTIWDRRVAERQHRLQVELDDIKRAHPQLLAELYERVGGAASEPPA